MWVQNKLSYLIGSVLWILSAPVSALSQEYYEEYVEVSRNTLSPIERVLTGGVANMAMFLIASLAFACLYTGGRTNREEKRTAVGLVCLLIVIGMACYRFGIWVDSFKPS